MCCSIALMGVAIAGSGALPTTGFVVFAGLSLLMGLSAPFYTGPHVALMQEKFPIEHLGRIFGFYGSLMSASMLLGLVTTGLTADIVGVNVWFLVSGVAISILAIIAVATPGIRNIEK